MVRLAVDCMGGDHGPAVTLPACRAFLDSHPGAELLLVGTRQALEPAVGWPRCRLVEATEVVTMDDPVEVALRRKKDSSMRVAIAQVKAEAQDALAADACVSAGNTGALMALSMFILRKVEGVHRPALVGSWPTRKGVTAMLDLGADIAADAEQLVEFAIMGAAFARAVHGVKNPRVALLNIGEEELKGHESIREGARLMRESNLPIDFRGFIEPDKIGHGDIDVVVSDGFTGNVALKTAEGIARMISDMLKDAFKSGPLAMLGAMLAMPALKSFRAKMDPRKVNGAVFLGLNGVVVKSHGGTDEVGFAQAVHVAASMGESRFRQEVEENLRRRAPAVATPVEQAAQ